jgi:predicted nucleic acid-binding protein
MNIIADTNIFLAVALDEPEKEHIIEVTAGCDVIAPEILPYEIGNALTALIKRGKISKDEALALYEVTQQIPVKLISVDIPKALAIATRFNLYAYDAYFIQCALAMSCALVTLDGKLKEVAKSLSIKVLE